MSKVVVITFFAALCVRHSSSYNKNDYIILTDKIQLHSMDKSYFQKQTFMRATYFNSTMPIIEAEVGLKRDLPYSTMIEVYGYKSSSDGKWSLNFREEKTHFCKYLEKNAHISSALVSTSNFPSCPWEAGNYKVMNLAIDEAVFPSNISEDNRKISVHFLVGDLDIFHFSVFAFIKKKDTMR